MDGFSLTLALIGASGAIFASELLRTPKSGQPESLTHNLAPA
jgi:hypothetical protein